MRTAVATGDFDEPISPKQYLAAISEIRRLRYALSYEARVTASILHAVAAREDRLTAHHRSLLHGQIDRMNAAAVGNAERTYKRTNMGLIVEAIDEGVYNFTQDTK